MTYEFPFVAQSMSLQIAFMAVVVAGLSIYMIATRNRVRRSMNQPRTTSRERYEGLSHRVQLSRDLEEVMNDLDELARQVNGKLDVRFAKLEAVIRDADERIDQLSRLMRSADGLQTIDVTVSEDGPSETEQSRSGEPQRSSGFDGQGSDEPHSSSDSQHLEVYALADQGVSPIDIAQQTNRTAGEVELILALRRAKSQADAITKTREPVGGLTST